MKKPNFLFMFRMVVLLSIPVFFACHKSETFNNPNGYDFSKPEKIFLSQSLDEISGIAFAAGNDSLVYAVNDEEGHVYYFKPDDKKYNSSKFGKKGDYEDIAICKQHVVVLRSDGSLYSFPLEAIGQEKIKDVIDYPQILPKGEYEGMAANEEMIHVLCKNCTAVSEKGQAIIYNVKFEKDSSLHLINSSIVDLSTIKQEKKKIKFHPSALAKNPVTNEWFIISSINKMLVVLDANWKLKEYFALDPALFKQPEGMAFNAKGDLYISNEMKLTAANILVFRFSAP